MLEQRLQQQFFESADLLYQAAEPLAGRLEQAAQTLLGCLTGGGKLLLTGGALAPHFAQLCVKGFERERPPLAALALAAADVDAQLHALGLPGDVLMIVEAGKTDWRAAVQAAHDKDMAVVALTGPQPAWADALTETDVWIAVPHERVARVHELQLLGLHALADALDLQLLGELDPI
jgi:D-sedoheptulose 7-phosphate isomerase